ncbi:MULTISPECIES: NAD(P)H-dependent oxidoreductase [Actinosynnema]|uniref:NADPH-dependent FMN reductase n=1 Tax=Actinosynnema pretiosum TaxID=42197 RepID=A0A290Z0S9_9PSEU|nr:NAD(P)H-dependent oxidoreductase [Actinosynnema pretiosum]ATE52614.1 NADPH-dependent FMN reductase [Actinosynnema pretiosum]
MSSVLVVSGSPSPGSRTGAVVSLVEQALASCGCEVRSLHVRRLPVLSLITEDLRDPVISDAVGAVLRADGVVVASPVYRAAHSGLVKALVDLLPEKALRGRPVLPVANGGAQGNLVAMDYALKPLLAVKGADSVLAGEFVLDQHIRGGSVAEERAVGLRLAVQRFGEVVRNASGNRRLRIAG